MINDGLAVNVGDNPGGQDGFLKMIDPAAPGAMTIGTLGGARQRHRRARRRHRSRPDPRRHRRRSDAGPERHAGRAGRWRLVVDRRRQGRRADRRGVGLHHLPRERPEPVDVGVGDRLRPGAQRCRRARAAGHDVRRPIRGSRSRTTNSSRASRARRRCRRCSGRSGRSVWRPPTRSRRSSAVRDVATSLTAAADQSNALIQSYNDRN